MPRSHPHTTTKLPPLPQPFINKKARILESLSVPEETYTDKSPKGSVDAPIIDLINEINAIDGLVTTSSCSGRVAVFVEGPDGSVKARAQGADQSVDNSVELVQDGEVDDFGDEEQQETKAVSGGPAGKGGGHWLYVSHDPVSIPQIPETRFFMRLCGLSEPRDASQSLSSTPTNGMVSKSRKAPRLIKISFSPLILHIHCATLAHAKPLLAAAINAGFRESGVQSLKALDDPDAGVTMGIRTAGLGFETVVGIVREDDTRGDQGVDDGEGVRYEKVVSEEYLATMFDVVNGRFEWNERRKERLRVEISKGFSAGLEWEDSEVRRRRKRQEGLKRQSQRNENAQKDGIDELVGAGVEVKGEANGVRSLFEDNDID